MTFFISLLVCLFIKKGKNKLGLSVEAALSSVVRAGCWWWSLKTSLLCPLTLLAVVSATLLLENNFTVYCWYSSVFVCVEVPASWPRWLMKIGFTDQTQGKKLTQGWVQSEMRGTALLMEKSFAALVTGGTWMMGNKSCGTWHLVPGSSFLSHLLIFPGSLLLACNKQNSASSIFSIAIPAKLFGKNKKRASH